MKREDNISIIPFLIVFWKLDFPSEWMVRWSVGRIFQVDNYMAGRTRMIVTLEVAAKVEQTNKEKLDQNVSEHSKEILNSVRILVSSAQPDQIKDPKLEVVKRKIKSGVEEIVGAGLIEEVLLPVWQVFISD